MIADNHATFQAGVWKSVLRWPKEETELLNPPTFYPLPQGIAEKHMSVIKRSIIDSGSQWPERVKYIAFAHNLCPLQGSSVCPYELVLGTKPETLVDLLTWTSNPNPDATLEEVHSKLVDDLEVARKYHEAPVTQLRQYGRDRYNSSHGDDLGTNQVLMVTMGPLGRSVSGPYDVIHREGNMIDLRISADETKRVALSQCVAYIAPATCESIDRRNLGTPNTSFDWGSLLAIAVEDLERGNLVLVR